MVVSNYFHYKNISKITTSKYSKKKGMGLRGLPNPRDL
jgi:hypothetical protein